MTHSIPQSDPRAFLICIDACHDHVCAGRFHNPCLTESGKFQSLSQMVLKIDRSLDFSNEPQAFQTRRRFSQSGMHFHESQDATLRPGRLATFVLHIHYRQNSSWQGTLSWQETGETMAFRSALELIALIDSAMEHKLISNSFFPQKRSEA